MNRFLDPYRLITLSPDEPAGSDAAPEDGTPDDAPETIEDDGLFEDAFDEDDEDYTSEDDVEADFLGEHVEDDDDEPEDALLNPNDILKEGEEAEDQPEEPVAEVETEDEPETPEPDPVLIQTVADLISKIKEVVPGAVIAGPDDLPEYVAAVIDANKELRETFAPFDNVLQANPAALELIEQLHAGKPLQEALLLSMVNADGDAIVELTEPDKSDDPEGWASWKLAREARERHRTEHAKAAADRAQRQQEYQLEAEKASAEFAEEHFPGDEKAAHAFFSRVNTLFNGDPETGKLMSPKEVFSLIHKGMSYDVALEKAAADLKAATDKARAEGRAEAANTLKDKRRSNGARPQLPTTGVPEAPHKEDRASSRNGSIHKVF